MDDTVSQNIRSAIGHYMQKEKIDGLVLDGIIAFSMINGDGETELVVTSTLSPIWTLRGMLIEADEAISMSYGFIDVEEEEE